MMRVLKRARDLMGGSRHSDQRESSKRVRRQLKQTRQQLRETKRQLRQIAREYVLCKMPADSVCAEIGVHEGEFSREIIDTVRPKRLHLIDPWRHEEGDECRESRYGGLGAEGQSVMDERYRKVQERFATEIQAGSVQIHRGFSSMVIDDFEDRYFDWIYLDGNHLYEYVKQDLLLYLPKVKSGGLIAGDDYGVRGWWENGVQRAVDEFVSQAPDLTLEVKATQFIIRVGHREDSAAGPHAL